jgi:hypothetical protein
MRVLTTVGTTRIIEWQVPLICEVFVKGPRSVSVLNSFREMNVYPLAQGSLHLVFMGPLLSRRNDFADRIEPTKSLRDGSKVSHTPVARANVLRRPPVSRYSTKLIVIVLIVMAIIGMSILILHQPEVQFKPMSQNMLWRLTAKWACATIEVYTPVGSHNGACSHLLLGQP